MLLTLGLGVKGGKLWPGVSSGVQVVRATSTQAEVIAESKSCRGDWREPVALSLGEGWRALPSDAVRLSWESQPGESVTLALTQQRGHVGRCWAESYMIGRKWLPESITGPLPVDPPVDPPGGIVPGEPCTQCNLAQPSAVIDVLVTCGGTTISGGSVPWDSFSVRPDGRCVWLWRNPFNLEKLMEVEVTFVPSSQVWDVSAGVSNGDEGGGRWFAGGVPADTFICDSVTGNLIGSVSAPAVPEFFSAPDCPDPGPATVTLGGA